jgi:hypothetical protein
MPDPAASGENLATAGRVALRVFKPPRVCSGSDSENVAASITSPHALKQPTYALVHGKVRVGPEPALSRCSKNPVCTENLIRVDAVMETPKLPE